MHSETHYHIRWSHVDWKSFPTREDASKVAEDIKKPNESYVIEQYDGACEHCRSFKSKAASRRCSTEASDD